MYKLATNLLILIIHVFLPWISNRTIRQHFPSESTEYNQHIGQLQRETTSIDENLESVFRTMWKTK